MSIMTNLPIAFRVDSLGIIFAALALLIFISAGIYSFDYMKHSEHKISYQIFFFAAMTVEVLACFAANIITFYMCFELLTVCSMPLVIQERRRQQCLFRGRIPGFGDVSLGTHFVVAGHGCRIRSRQGPERMRNGFRTRPVSAVGRRLKREERMANDSDAPPSGRL